MQSSEAGQSRRDIVSRVRALVAPIAIIATLAGTRVAGAQEVGIMVGAAAPGASVESLDGRAMNLSKYVGKGPVVLEFWATWCPVCKELEAPLAAARRKYGERVTFVSVGVHDNQTPNQQKKYATRKRIGGEFVFDRRGEAVAAYKVPHTSYLVAIDAKGTVVYTGAGGDQDIDAAVARALIPDGAMGKMSP